MPTPINIEIFNIARTQVDREEVARWLEHLGVLEFRVPPDGAISEPALLIALAAKRCYKSFEVNPNLNPNITRIRSDWGEYLDNVMKSGHGSVLEHSVFTFSIEGVSRVFTAEMNRHRAGWAISEGSLRFIRFGQGIPYWEPDSIKGLDVLDGPQRIAFGEMDPEAVLDAMQREEDDAEARLVLDGQDAKREATRFALFRAFENQEHWYRVMEEIWKDELAEDSKFSGKKEITSLMRRIVGLGVATGGVWSGNVRALRHVMTMRCEPAAEEEILHTFSRIAMRMHDQEPLLFGDFQQDDKGFWRPKYRKI